MITKYINQSLAGVLRLLLVAGLIAGAMLVISPSHAALAASADDGFNPGANDDVNTLAVQADGKIVVGGSSPRWAGIRATTSPG
jgi:hypothetical protein